LHDAATLSALAIDIRSKLSPVERMGLVGHQWAAVQAGHAAIDSFLDLAAVFADETDHDVLAGLTAPLAYIEDQLLGRDEKYRGKFRNWVVGTFGPAWARLGWEAAPDEDEDRRLLRAALLRLVGEVGADPRVAAEAAERFPAYLRDRGSLEPNLADSLVAIAARNGDASRYEAFLRAVREARTPQERRRFQLSLGEFRERELFERTLSLTLTPEVATQDVGLVLVRLFGNPAARHAAWRFLRDHWQQLAERLPPMMVSRVIEATPSLGELRFRREVASFFRRHPVPTARRALEQALERFELHADLARRTRGRLRKWLDAKAPAESREGENRMREGEREGRHRA
jgi:puromycin-sensitive aminopeptidase